MRVSAARATNSGSWYQNSSACATITQRPTPQRSRSARSGQYRTAWSECETSGTASSSSRWYVMLAPQRVTYASITDCVSVPRDESNTASPASEPMLCSSHSAITFASSFVAISPITRERRRRRPQPAAAALTAMHQKSTLPMLNPCGMRRVGPAEIDAQVEFRVTADGLPAGVQG